MNVLTTTLPARPDRVRPEIQAAPARNTVAALPITIEPPRGGVFPERDRRAAVPTRSAPQGAHAREIVLAAIWPLLRDAAGPAPGSATATICDAAVARIRALLANAIASFRARVGAAAGRLGGAERVAIEDWAMMLPVDEAGLLDRMVGLLSPPDLLRAAIGDPRSPTDTIARSIAARVELHMLGLLQEQRTLSETAKAMLLFALSDTSEARD